MTFNEFLNCISKIEQIPVSGQESQLKMSPPFRRELIKLQQNNIKNAKQSAVLALCYPNQNNKTMMVFILRKTYKGVHSGQIGFPGGKTEELDTSLKDTALRETEEEIGVSKSSITILKSMTSIYIPPSNFVVHPFLGVLNSTPIFKKEDKEVEQIIEIPLQDILNDSNVISTSVSTSYKVAVNVPAFKLKDQIIWGATAMMLSEIKDLLKQVL
ncbi:CoA pyrophosphatase [Ichthyenterobacterium sp. W332]|uniref:CoA pyrophosphatase n=1 Tax=Microcosmobacter mediterraneus TaxID=3075607 RepID=A0ABU2YHZ7_9FLAO|nr:CoA pyrophosphatase [Ichthyenterobacterium sp. W332]MDT0557400.1 CoA pyrophosphatase [Ichthyenterobacterium sp. W332]